MTFPWAPVQWLLHTGAKKAWLEIQKVFRVQDRKQFVLIPPQLSPLHWPFQWRSRRLWWTQMGSCSPNILPCSLDRRTAAVLNEGWARSSPSILPEQFCQQGSIRSKIAPLVPFQGLYLVTETTLSYHFRTKSVFNPEWVLEESVQRVRVSILSSYSKFGSWAVTVNKQQLALFFICYPWVSRIAQPTAEGRNRQAQLRFSQ